MDIPLLLPEEVGKQFLVRYSPNRFLFFLEIKIALTHIRSDAIEQAVSNNKYPTELSFRDVRA